MDHVYGSLSILLLPLARSEVAKRSLNAGLNRPTSHCGLGVFPKEGSFGFRLVWYSMTAATAG